MNLPVNSKCGESLAPYKTASFPERKRMLSSVWICFTEVSETLTLFLEQKGIVRMLSLFKP